MLGYVRRQRYLKQQNYTMFRRKGFVRCTQMSCSCYLYLLMECTSHLKVQQPLTWSRYMYIDDIFLIWTHGQPQLQLFIDHLNSHHHSIVEWSTDSVSFLDTKVYPENGWIGTDLYCNPTDTHQYLSQDSCHPNTSQPPSPTARPYSSVEFAHAQKTLSWGQKNWSSTC